MSLPWFRMYAEFSGDPVIQSLAFEDQRHYVILLCLKCSGTLDRDISHDQRDRVITKGLGLDPTSAAEVKRRLIDVGLIDKSWHPSAWEKRQFKDRHGVAAIAPEGRAYVYFIGPENGELIKIGYSKNPWARVKDFQTGAAEQLEVVATVSTTDNSETQLHTLFAQLRKDGEWFLRNGELNQVINEIRKKILRTDNDVVSYVAKLRSTTTDTEQIQNRTDTEAKQKPLSGEPDVEAVFVHWQTVLKHPQAKLTPERQRKIKTALKNYSAASLCKAVDGCAKTPHNMGDNDRGEVYDDIELILRDAKHIERFMRNAENPPIAKKTTRASGRKTFDDYRPKQEARDEHPSAIDSTAKRLD